MRHVVLVILLAGGCIAYQPSQLEQVCVRYVGADGYLYGRDATFNTQGARAVLKRLRFSHRGACVSGVQGPSRRITVCLAASSRCSHDRTTNVWEDQWEQYRERYPWGIHEDSVDHSHKGACQSECSKQEDDCVSRLDRFGGGLLPVCYSIWGVPIFDKSQCGGALLPEPTLLPDGPPPENDL